MDFHDKEEYLLT